MPGLILWAWLAVVPLQALPSPYTASPTASDNLEAPGKPTTDPNTDLYVIHAMVYEIGILANSSDSNETSSDKGEQVAVTFFHKNGSEIDFSKIPEPLYTNLTGRAVTGVAPAPPPPPPAPPTPAGPLAAAGAARFRPRRQDTEWMLPQMPIGDALDHLNSCSDESEYVGEDEEEGVINETSNSDSSSVEDSDTWKILIKRDVDNYAEIERKPESYWHVKSVPTSDHVVKMPSQYSVQSIGIPPLLSLNTNLSDIPVPFPNTSIIRYSTLSSHTVAINDSQTT